MITLLSMAAILCLPRQFYIGVIEASSADDVALSRYAFVAYLTVTVVVVVPITLAGLALLPGEARPDLFLMSLPLAAGSNFVTLIVFLGGFSAATAMVVVETIALSTMVSNDFIAPLLLRNPLFLTDTNLGKVRLIVRCIAIILVMSLALAWALGIPAGSRLASIGLVAFAAMAQFAPILVLAVYGSNRDALAAKAGLATGLLVWLHTLGVPQVASAEWLAALEPTILNPTGLLGIDGLSPISHGTIWS